MDDPDPAQVLDPAQVAALRASMSDADFRMLRDLVDIDLAERVAQLERACATGPDIAALARAAHQLLGSARNIGAEPLALAAQQLEHDAATMAPAALAALVARIARLAVAARAAFTAAPG